VVVKLLAEGTTVGGLDPPVVADVVLDGILTDRFMVTPHSDDVVALATMRLQVAETGALTEHIYAPMIDAELLTARS
jgi:hypothetical protein